MLALLAATKASAAVWASSPPTKICCEHVEPVGALLSPAADDVVVVAQVRHHDLELSHTGLVLSAGIDIALRGTHGEETGQTDALGALLRVVADKADEGLGSLDLGSVAVIKDTEAPDAAAQGRSLLIGGESHSIGGKET